MIPAQRRSTIFSKLLNISVVIIVMVSKQTVHGTSICGSSRVQEMLKEQLHMPGLKGYC